jgi:NADH:ubiquinone oxidoreductase subunit 2 (subunit N)
MVLLSSFCPNVSGAVMSYKRKEDRRQIRLLSAFRLSVFLSVSLNPEAFWLPDVYSDSMISFATTLTPLSL